MVQIMREFRGIEMPKYYCKRYPSFDIADVEGKNKRVRLNEQRPNGDRTSLKSISLGDAFFVLEQLKKEDKKGFFCNFPWLNDRIFIESWPKTVYFS